jgi:hypothetical protein
MAEQAEHKRYFVFSFHPYEANGGMGDYDGSFDSIEEARNVVSRDYVGEIAILVNDALVVIASRNPGEDWS